MFDMKRERPVWNLSMHTVFKEEAVGRYAAMVTGLKLQFSASNLHVDALSSLLSTLPNHLKPRIDDNGLSGQGCL